MPSWFVPAYLMLITVFVFAYIAYASFGPTPDEFSQRIIDSTSGFLLGSLLVPVINFLIGSSLGSKEKQGSLDRIAEYAGTKRE